MNKRHFQKGSALIVVIIAVVVLIFGGLGYVLLNNITKVPVVSEGTKVSPPEVQSFCTVDENVSATKGTFCSEDVGIKLAVPGIFAGKLEKVANYDIFQGGADPSDKKSAGTSESVYSAVINDNDTFILTISQEPMRSGYVDFPYLMQPTYFSESTRILSQISSPTHSYDSKTNKTTTEGEYVIAKDVPSFEVGAVRVYKGGYGDVGQIADAYFMVIKDKIVKITLKQSVVIGAPSDSSSVINQEKVFAELDKSIRSLSYIK